MYCIMIVILLIQYCYYDFEKKNLKKVSKKNILTKEA